MDEQERKAAAHHLTVSEERLLGLVDGLTAEQWVFQPGKGRWSICECLEHVMRVESRILGLIEKKIERPPDKGKQDSVQAQLVRERDAALVKMLPDRETRREAPEAVRPIGQWPDMRVLLAEFHRTRARTSQFVANTEADLRGYSVPHPAFGDLDCYQWLLMLGLHGERHARQIEEIKADSAYPRS